jgi:hypothetical protein
MAAKLALLALALAVAASGSTASGAGGQGGTSWERHEPGGRTACARGGKYAFWSRAGDPTRLVLFFQGGGGCFDERTCAPGSGWFDDAVDATDDPAFGQGILDLADRRNPFRRWTWVFLPSCAGDVHLGFNIERRFGRRRQ